MNRVEDLASTLSFTNRDENISSPKQYDIIVLGSGEGSKYIAWTLAKQGKHVAVVERKYIGGSCPNIACFRAKISYTAPRLPLTFAGAKSSESPKTVSRSTWPPYAIASAR